MDPVLVVLVSQPNECHHCEALLKIWHKITNSLLTVYPKLKFPNATLDTKNYKYPPIMIKDNQISSSFPKDLNNYFNKSWTWNPMTLLIPGESWQRSLKEDVKLENVQIMNSKLVDDIYQYIPIWNTRNEDNFGLWLKETLPKIHQPIKFFPSIIEKINNPIITSIDLKKDICQNSWNIISRNNLNQI